MGDSVTLNAGLRVRTAADENAAMIAQARTLMDCAHLAVMASFPAESLEEMGPAGVAGSALQVALQGVLKTPIAVSVASFEAVGFAFGLAFGEMLRHAENVDLGPISEAIGAGMMHSLTQGHPQPKGPMQ